jgi:3-carboxy-cis,cis-muconate cycloisomerase
VLIDKSQMLDESLTKLASENGNSPLTDRTSRQATLPITVADKIRSWRQPVSKQTDSLIGLNPTVERPQLGGLVGTRHVFGDASAASPLI